MARFPIAGSCIFAFVLSGCAYINPYVEVAKNTPSEEAISPKLPQVAASVRFLHTTATDVEAKRDDVNKTHRTLDILTFGFASAAAVAPVYKAHRDLITGLAIAAGTTYTANTLFFATNRSALYGAAATSLICLKDKAFVVSGAVSAVYAKDGTDALAEAFDRARTFPCMPQADQDLLYDAYSAADRSARRAVGADGLMSTRLRTAGTAVISALNSELDKGLPSPESVFGAAKAGVLGLGLTPGPTPKPEKTSRDTRQCTDPQLQAAQREKARAIAEFDRMRKDLEAALDSIDQLDKACTFSVAEVADLSVSQDNVTLMKDIEIHIRVSGGRPPYRFDWDSDPASSGVQVTHRTPETIVLRGGDIKADKTLKLEVRDISAAARTKVVTVSAKKPAS